MHESKSDVAPRTIAAARLAVLTASLLLAGACARADASADAGASTGATNAALDSLNARIVRAYETHDPKAYGALYTDSAQFEWANVPTVRSRAGMETMAREVWQPLADIKLSLKVDTRRLAPSHATEIGAFQESWRDSTGGRTTEYGRYVVVFAKSDSAWKIDRFFGFEDSTRHAPSPAPTPAPVK